MQLPLLKDIHKLGQLIFPAAICSSVDDEVVHGIPGNKILKEGEIISLDVGVIKNGYYGDAALSVAVGNISEEKKKLMEVTEKSLYYGIEAGQIQ